MHVAARVLLGTAVVLCTATGADEAIAPGRPWTVVLKSGPRLKGQVDSRTDAGMLWLNFGNERVRVTRRFAWEEVDAVRVGEQMLTREAVLEHVRTLPAEAHTSPPRRWTFPPAERAISTQVPAASRAVAPFELRRFEFSAEPTNWDADVEVDGLQVMLFPLDEAGRPAAVEGTLRAELWAMRRVDQDGSPNSRGRRIEKLDSWVIPVRAAESPYGLQVQLPYQSWHPEFDTDWAPYGLLHLTLVVPGRGVFHHSRDGVRLRPYAPLRDYLELQRGGQRFLPTEATGPK